MTDTTEGRAATACESRILCEGYYDRALWSGWLKHREFKSLRRESDKIYDPWRRQVTRGHYAFLTPSDHFVRIVPCHGKENLGKVLQSDLKGIETHPIKNLIVNWDADTPDNHGGDDGRFRKSIDTAIDNALNQVSSFKVKRKTDDWIVSGGEIETRVSLVVWKTSDSASDFLPGKQTLERLVCAAICEAYPERGQEVAKWLQSRTNPPASNPKEFSWSHMAGWYAERGGEAFYSAMWEDPSIVKALEKRLKENGSWSVADKLLDS